MKLVSRVTHSSSEVLCFGSNDTCIPLFGRGQRLECKLIGNRFLEIGFESGWRICLEIEFVKGQMSSDGYIEIL